MRRVHHCRPILYTAHYQHYEPWLFILVLNLNKLKASWYHLNLN